MANYVALGALLAMAMLVAMCPAPDVPLLIPAPRQRPRWRSARWLRDLRDEEQARGWLDEINEAQHAVPRQAVRGAVVQSYLPGRNQPPWPVQSKPSQVEPTMVHVEDETQRLFRPGVKSISPEIAAAAREPRMWMPDDDDPPTIVRGMRAIIDEDLGGYLEDLPRYSKD